jgi:hypothetical protein
MILRIYTKLIATCGPATRIPNQLLLGSRRNLTVFPVVDQFPEIDPVPLFRAALQKHLHSLL